MISITLKNSNKIGMSFWNSKSTIFAQIYNWCSNPFINAEGVCKKT